MEHKIQRLEKIDNDYDCDFHFSLSFLQDSEMMYKPESDQMSPVEPKVVCMHTHTNLYSKGSHK